MSFEIIEIKETQFEMVWPIFKAVVSAGNTYPYDPETTFEQAVAMWTHPPARCFAALDGTVVVGAYFIKPNQPGLGNHVANAGYMVAPEARGRGVASELCVHSMEMARKAGFTAMQFNFVVSSNEVAVRLWQKHGFNIIGRVPGAFRHRELGPTDILIMHRFL